MHLTSEMSLWSITLLIRLILAPRAWINGIIDQKAPFNVCHFGKTADGAILQGKEIMLLKLLIVTGRQQPVGNNQRDYRENKQIW